MKINPYNYFELHRFKVGAFFETQCIQTIVWNSRGQREYLLIYSYILLSLPVSFLPFESVCPWQHVL